MYTVSSGTSPQHSSDKLSNMELLQPYGNQQWTHMPTDYPIKGPVKYPNRYSSGIIPSGITGQKIFFSHWGNNKFNCVSTANK